MPTKVPSLSEVSKKWAEVTPGRAGYYESGVKGAGADWEKGATEGVSAWKAAISAANVDKMMAGGIKRAGAEKYVRKAGGVGVSHFSSGISAGQPDFEKGMSPVLDTISKVDKPARFPRGNTANRKRSEVYQEALTKMRAALRGAGG